MSGGPGAQNGKGGPKRPELCIKTIIRLCTGISQNHHPCLLTLPFVANVCRGGESKNYSYATGRHVLLTDRVTPVHVVMTEDFRHARNWRKADPELGRLFCRRSLNVVTGKSPVGHTSWRSSANHAARFTVQESRTIFGYLCTIDESFTQYTRESVISFHIWASWFLPPSVGRLMITWTFS